MRNYYRNNNFVDNRIVIKCVHCHNKLRVPLDKGKISVTCPVCGKAFNYNPDSILDTLKQIVVGALSRLPKKWRSLYIFLATVLIVLIIALIFFFSTGKKENFDPGPGTGSTVYDVQQEHRI